MPKAKQHDDVDAVVNGTAPSQAEDAVSRPRGGGKAASATKASVAPTPTGDAHEASSASSHVPPSDGASSDGGPVKKAAAKAEAGTGKAHAKSGGEEPKSSELRKSSAKARASEVAGSASQDTDVAAGAVAGEASDAGADATALAKTQATPLDVANADVATKPAPAPQHKAAEHKAAEHKAAEHKAAEHKAAEHKAPAEHKKAKPKAKAEPATGAGAPVPVVAGPERALFLQHQRELLGAERNNYMRQAEELRAEAAALALEHEPGDVQFDEEGGEGGTANVDRELDLHLSAQAQAAIEEIDAAMDKIEAGTYGFCESCTKPIPEARLEALPHARLCVTCKSGGLTARRQ
jgi:DnaK suppressor protein